MSGTHSSRIPENTTTNSGGGAQAPLTFFPAGFSNVRIYGADRARCGRRSARIGADRRGALIEDADFPLHIPATASLPRASDQREREPNAGRAAPVLRHSHPRKKELAARAPVRQARPLEPVLDDPETPHNEARGGECP